jgi:hypothetical protein
MLNIFSREIETAVAVSFLKGLDILVFGNASNVW